MIYKALDEYSKRDLNPHSHYWPKDFKSFVSTIPPFEHPQKRRAENETRTRDPNLGKVMLYQLSYFRKLNFVIQKSERLVPRTGLEPACLSTHAPETCASTNSATWAKLSSIISKKQERKTRLELATLTLARLCSTN